MRPRRRLSRMPLLARTCAVRPAVAAPCPTECPRHPGRNSRTVRELPGAVCNPRPAVVSAKVQDLVLRPRPDGEAYAGAL